MSKMIANLDKYYVSPMGQIYNTENGYRLSQFKDRLDNMCVTIYIRGTGLKTYRVKNLVADRYLAPPIVENWQRARVTHKNNKRWDNRAENLEWVVR